MPTRTLEALQIWAERHARSLFRWLVLGVVALALLLRTAHLTDVSSRSPDERLYAQSAQRIAAEGPAAYREIFAEYSSDPSRWIYPSPTRVVPVLLFAAVMTVTGSSSAQAGAAVSWALGVASVLVLAWLGRRFFGRAIGVLAALFLATYVADLEFARRAWGECTASFLSVVLMYAACALEAQPERWRGRIAFFAMGTLCLLVKETCIFSYALCGAWLVGCRLVKARDYASAALFTAGGLASVLAAFGVLVLLSGSVSHALHGLLHVFGNGLGSNDWGAQNASGPWYQFVHLLGSMAPFTAAMASIGVLVCVLPPASARVFRGLEPGARTAASLALLLTLAFVAASAFGPNLQYLRIMAPANPSYCLLAALGVHAVLNASEAWLRGKAHALAPTLLALLFVGSSWRDFSLYTDVVVRSGMQDLAVRWLLDGIARRDRAGRAPARSALAAAKPAAPLVSAVPPTPSEPAETAANWIDRSLEHCRRQEWSECVSAAQAALRRDPRGADAWNNAAVGYAGLRLWDDAARCAGVALELRPDFQLAKNNLAWVTEERAKLTASIDHH